MFLTFGLLILAFFLYLTWKDRHAIASAWQSYRWLPAHAKVVDSKDNSFVIDGANQYTGSHPTKYQETLYAFRYHVDNGTYISHCYSFGGHIDQFGAFYRIGDPVIIYYDPHNPHRAVVKRGLTFSTLSAPLLALFTLGWIVWFRLH